MVLNEDIFSYNLKRLLKMNGIRNVELAKHLGVSKSAISNYLAGTSVPKLETIAKIALYFDVGVDVLLKDYIDKPKTEINEDNKVSFTVPLFCKELQEGDVVFRNDNYQGNIYSPFPVHKDSQCYAVMIYDNDMAHFGMAEKSIAIFSCDEDVLNGDIAAVLIKSTKTITVRVVNEDKNEIVLTSDKDSHSYKKTSKGCDVIVLGKVVGATFNPNKKNAQ